MLEGIKGFALLIAIIYFIHTWFKRREYEADYYRESMYNLDKDFVLSDIQNYKKGGPCFLGVIEHYMFNDPRFIDKYGIHDSGGLAADRYYRVAEHAQKVALLAKITPCKKCAGCQRFYKQGTSISEQPFFGTVVNRSS